MLKFILCPLFVLLFSLTSMASVWENLNSWDAQWEAKYQNWVLTSWDKYFFTKKSIYQDLLVDCADTVYSMRYVFAAENNLPFVINDPTGGKLPISNDMNRWDHLLPDQRKREFLFYLFDLVSTQSIPNDTYPVAVNRQTLTSGTLLRTDQASHHSWTIKYIGSTGIPYLIYSSRPAKSNLFTRYEYPSTAFTFPNGNKPETRAGFLGFRWPQHLKWAVWRVPGYSLEQYNIPLATWGTDLQEILKLRNETLNEKVSRMILPICQGGEDRIEYVNEALIYSQSINRCMNAKEFDDFSSPSRDKRLRNSIDELKKLYDSLIKDGSISQLDPLTIDKLEQIFDGAPGNYCPLDVSSTLTISLNDMVQAFNKGWLSSNPNDPVEARWGLTRPPGNGARYCPIY